MNPRHLSARPACFLGLSSTADTHTFHEVDTTAPYWNWARYESVSLGAGLFIVDVRSADFTTLRRPDLPNVRIRYAANHSAREVVFVFRYLTLMPDPQLDPEARKRLMQWLVAEHESHHGDAP